MSFTKSLDYPLEILISILEESKWNPELRSVKHYLLDIYNQYSKFKIEIRFSDDLKRVREEFPFAPIKINITSLWGNNFIPDNFERVYSINLQSFHNKENVFKIANILKTNKTLISARVHNIFIGDEGAIAFADALEVNTTLTFLQLSDNRISDKGARALAKALKINRTLKSLDLSDNRIEDRGATDLAGALRINTTLTSLNLSDNRIGDIRADLAPFKGRIKIRMIHNRPGYPFPFEF